MRFIKKPELRTFSRVFFILSLKNKYYVLTLFLRCHADADVIPTFSQTQHKIVLY